MTELSRCIEKAIKVWDSMEGELPSYQGFLSFYIQEKMGSIEELEEYEIDYEVSSN